MCLNYKKNTMINYFLILFNILIKNERINLFFKSDKKETIDKKKIDSTSSYILKYYTNYSSVREVIFLKHYDRIK